MVLFENYETKRTEILSENDIIYITTAGRRCRIVSTRNEYIANETFKSLKRRMDDSSFCDSHGSYYVNMAFVVYCTKFEVCMRHKEMYYKIHMSRRHYNKFIEKYKLSKYDVLTSCIHI